MAYTPELTYENSCILRRIAWSLDKNMKYTIQLVISDYAKGLNAEDICTACKDPTKCNTCPFKKKGDGRQ